MRDYLAGFAALRGNRRGGVGSLVGLLFRQGLRHPLEGELQHPVDPLDRNDLELVLDVVRDLGEVLDVLLGDQRNCDAAAM